MAASGAAKLDPGNSLGSASVIDTSAAASATFETKDTSCLTPENPSEDLNASKSDDTSRRSLDGVDPFLLRKELEKRQDSDDKSYLNPVEIPRLPWGHPDIREKYMKAKIPVVIKNAKLVSGALNDWTPEYLLDKLKDRGTTVYKSKNNKFRYWNMKRDPTNKYNFSKPTEQLKLPFNQFLKHAEEFEESKGSKVHVYAQESLTGHKELKHDFLKWDWGWILGVVSEFKWGLPTENLLLMGLKGNITPCHYDEQENIFCQVNGLKSVVLYPPGDFRCLYPFPIDHPCDRQAMVNTEEPDLLMFPRFAYARPHHALLEKGDCLYLPALWWHHFVNQSHLCTSITFWCKQPATDEKIELPLQQHQLLSLRRNIERIVLAQMVPLCPEATSLREAMLLTVRKPTCKLRQYINNVLKMVLKEEEIDMFLEELAVGRYDHDLPVYNKFV